MDRQHGHCRFTTKISRDDVEGWIALDLYRLRFGTTSRAARVVYWDADGQLSLETYDGDVWVVILEELIAEARQANWGRSAPTT